MFVSDQARWSDKSSVFYWVVDRLAEQVTDDDVAKQLREISEFNVGMLMFDEFTPDQRRELVALIAALPQTALAQLPDTPAREPIATRLTELVQLVEST
ncbi:hypothetical protein [Cellulomonas sp. URHD0024]|uniref:hypothetical protein n=1 Tax=Cellulomonas sp. URHD0024 TaxID=1302620 RepID=UPI0012DE9853|nr:hypothetical protein [Cellulomonas sp. URHD0024]